MYNELNWEKLLQQNDGACVKTSIPFSMNTTYLQKDFRLDIIIRNLSEDNLAFTKKLVSYVLTNFDKLFETGWTAFYYDRASIPELEVAGHTLQEFYEEQIDFAHEEDYYSIQLEINCEHFSDGIPRYCFVVQTAYCDWMIAEDNMRLYMIDNKCWGFNDNNDDTQMCSPLKDIPYYGWASKKELTNLYNKEMHHLIAPPFSKFFS